MVVRNFDDVLTSVSPSIAALKKELGDMHTKAILTIIIDDLINFFSIGKSMGADQIAQTIQLIQEEYFMLKPEDFKLCFNNAKKGKYGKVYDRLDGQIILEWISKYQADRFSHSEQKSIQRHYEINAGSHTERQQHLDKDKEKSKEIHKIQVEQFIKNVRKDG